jgi:uncharacterized oligopeptide transporter (OPT) family protein
VQKLDAGARHAEAPSRELTVRAVVVAVLVSVMIGASYPYVVLKLGYGPNISVVSAFFGYIALAFVGLVTRVRATRFDNILAQAAGTAAGQSAFMCVVLAAIDMLNQRPELGFSLHLAPWQIFAWLSLGGVIGVLMAVPVRRHYIDEEKLPFADGMAAGETLMVLYRDPREAMARLKALVYGMGSSMVVAIARLIPVTRGGEPSRLLPEVLPFGAWGAKLNMGTELGLLSIGARLLVGLRICVSMAIGMTLTWILAPPMLIGGTIQAIWAHRAPKHEEAYNTPLASGFIAGEALVVLAQAILALAGIKT